MNRKKRNEEKCFSKMMVYIISISHNTAQHTTPGEKKGKGKEKDAERSTRSTKTSFSPTVQRNDNDPDLS